MKNKRGEGYISVCVLIIIICMLLSIFITFATTVGAIKQVKRNARVVLDNYVMEQSIEIYDSIKNGNDETLALYANDYVSELCEFCTFAKKSSKIYNYDSEGNTLYYLTIPSLGYTDDGELKVYTRFTLYIPLYFAGHKVSTVSIPITITSKYAEKF